MASDNEDSGADNEDNEVHGPGITTRNSHCGDDSLFAHQALKESVRPFIDMVDKLREIGLDHEVDLPSITIIGDQSSGKSSVLEAISGVRLPRGTGMVTRCPVELRLIKSRSTTHSWSCKCSYGNKQFIIDSPDDVEEKIAEAQDDLRGSDVISEEPITLEILSDAVPDLTIIDLPGIIAVSTEGKPSDLPDQIKRMVEVRIKKPETIILVVVPANVDIANTTALSMAADVDPHHERTIGIITKPDLIDRGTEQDLVDVLHNDRKREHTYYLKKGYSVIKCRSKQNIESRQSWEEALNEERRFFEDNVHFRDVDESQIGVSSLQRKLSRELVLLIKTCRPKLEDSINTRKLEIQNDLKKLGDKPTTDKVEKLHHLIKLVKELTEHITKVCKGEAEIKHGENERKEVWSRLYAIVKTLYVNFQEEVYKNNPALNEDRERAAILEDKKNNPGRELPGFNKYSLLTNPAKRYLEKCQKPANTCLTESFKAMEKMLRSAVEQTFGKYPALVDKFKTLALELMSEHQKTCQVQMNDEFDKEKLIFTQDSSYLRAHQKVEKLKEEGTYGQLLPEIAVADEEDVVEHENRRHNGFELASGSDNAAVNATFLALLTFVEISQERIVDNIPMTITLHMLERLPEKICTEFIALTAEGDVLEMIRENEETTNKREDLNRRLTILNRAFDFFIAA